MTKMSCFINRSFVGFDRQTFKEALADIPKTPASRELAVGGLNTSHQGGNVDEHHEGEKETTAHNGQNSGDPECTKGHCRSFCVV